MILTCEPGIYIPEEGLGIRLENDILIKDGGNIDLMEKGIGIIRDLTPEEKDRVARWVMLWEKTYEQFLIHITMKKKLLITSMSFAMAACFIFLNNI